MIAIKFIALNAVLMTIILNHAYADCTFLVNNNSSSKVSVEAGITTKGAIPIKFAILPNSSIKKTLKSNYNCTSYSLAGLGLAYINLINDQSSGSWRYIPQNKQIKAVGFSDYANNHVIGLSENGQKLILFNNDAPTDNLFEVMINSANNNDAYKYTH